MIRGCIGSKSTRLGFRIQLWRIVLARWQREIIPFWLNFRNVILPSSTQRWLRIEHMERPRAFTCLLESAGVVFLVIGKPTESIQKLYSKPLNFIFHVRSVAYSAKCWQKKNYQISRRNWYKHDLTCWRIPFTTKSDQFQISPAHSVKSLAFHTLLRCKMITLPIITTLTHTVLFTLLGECTFRVKGLSPTAPQRNVVLNSW